MPDIEQLSLEKGQCIEHLNDYKRIRNFYTKIKQLSLDELEELFPAPAEIIAQNIFDCTNQILAEPTIDSAIKVSIDLFNIDNIEKCKDETFDKDLELLQALFFFLIQDISSGTESDYSKLFSAALSDGSWRKAERQAEILNAISAGLGFNVQNPFIPFDFTELGGIHFKANESVLRLMYNFVHPELYTKEGIINELNFVREQQKNILPVFPNTKKTNYKTSAANNEIKNKKENLEKLKELDFGFNDPQYCQSFFAGSEEFKETFMRPIECKCFQETELEWEHEPYFDKRSWRRKIIAKKSDRAANKSALYNKFLYSERNMLTHLSENFAVFKLFLREYNSYEKKFWEELVLDSMYDVREYISTIIDENVSKKLMTILNHYLKKIADALGMQSELPEAQLWNYLFDSNGDLNLEPGELKKTNIFNILEEPEQIHFKRFMSFMYCAENDENDFFERNRLRIQLYLIHLSLSLSKMDK